MRRSNRSALTALVAVPLCLGLAACGGSNDTETSPSAASAADTTSTSSSSASGSSDDSTSATSSDDSSSASGSASGSQTGAAAALPEKFEAFGTEPFWSLTVTGQNLVYKTLENQDPGKSLTGTRSGGTISGEDGKDAFKLTVTEAKCNDGMSDEEYPYKVEFDYGTEKFTGCAEKK